MTRGSYSNHTRLSPSTVRTFESCPHDIDVTCTIEGIVHTPWGHFSGNNLLDGLVNLVGTGINAVGSTQLLSHFELVGIDINSNNLASSRHFGTLNSSKSHSTKPEYSHTRIRWNFTSIPNCTEPSR